MLLPCNQWRIKGAPVVAQMFEHNSEMPSEVVVLVSVRVIICFGSRSESGSGLGLG